MLKVWCLGGGSIHEQCVYQKKEDDRKDGCPVQGIWKKPQSWDARKRIYIELF